MDNLQLKTAFKSYFLSPKKPIIQQAGSAWNFIQPSIHVHRGAYIPHFKRPHFLPLIFEEYINPQVRINKMVNGNTVDYNNSPPELTWRIQPLIFPWPPRGFISSEYFLNFCPTCMTHHSCGKISVLWG